MEIEKNYVYTSRKKIMEGNNKNIFNNKIKELDEFIFQINL